MGILYLASSVLSLFFILLLAGKKDKSFSDKILVAWFLLLFSNAAAFYLIIINQAHFVLIEFLNHSVFLHGPILLFYTSALTRNLDKISWKSFYHFIPFVVLFSAAIVIKVLRWEYSGIYHGYLIIFKFLVPLIYALISLRILKRHRNLIQKIYSTTTEMELNWLSYILVGSIVLVIFGSGSFLIHYLTPIDIPEHGGLYLNIAYNLSIILLGYFGFKQTAIFIPAHLHDYPDAKESTTKDYPSEKYHKNKLSLEYVDKAFRDLERHMLSEKPFTDPDLTLFTLASQLNTTENKLSQVINRKAGCNFFEYVNTYRVEMVKERMIRGDHKYSTLLGLAYDSGFNSKSSFNRAFKKFTGLTPSKYLKRIS